MSKLNTYLIKQQETFQFQQIAVFPEKFFCLGMFSALEVCFWKEVRKEVLSRADTTHPNWNKFEWDCVGPRHMIVVVKGVNSFWGAGGGAASNVFGIICPPGLNRVDWSSKFQRVSSPPQSSSNYTSGSGTDQSLKSKKDLRR